MVDHLGQSDYFWWWIVKSQPTATTIPESTVQYNTAVNYKKGKSYQHSATTALNLVVHMLLYRARDV